MHSNNETIKEGIRSYLYSSEFECVIRQIIITKISEQSINDNKQIIIDNINASMAFYNGESIEKLGNVAVLFYDSLNTAVNRFFKDKQIKNLIKEYQQVNEETLLYYEIKNINRNLELLKNAISVFC